MFDQTPSKQNQSKSLHAPASECYLVASRTLHFSFGPMSGFPKKTPKKPDFLRGHEPPNCLSSWEGHFSTPSSDFGQSTGSTRPPNCLCPREKKKRAPRALGFQETGLLQPDVALDLCGEKVGWLLSPVTSDLASTTFGSRIVVPATGH